MLKDDFFKINSIETSEGTINAALEINASHKIFEGHFPGIPVVPGVCMMQMIKEVLESVIGRATRLKQADHLKFLAVINPVENNLVNALIKYSSNGDGSIKVNASLSNTTATNLKLQALFI